MDVVIQMLRARIAAATNLPLPVFEPAQIMHYSVGEEFRPHFDFLTEHVGRAAQMRRFGQRIATFLIYLNDDFEGGETEFPRTGISHRGRKGDALFWANVDPPAAPDPLTFHAGQPPTSGEKWILSSGSGIARRRRVSGFRPSSPSWRGSGCARPVRSPPRSVAGQMPVTAISASRRPCIAEIDRIGGDAAGEPLRGLDRAVLVEMVEDQAELAAAGPGEHVGRPDQAAEQAGDMDEGGVAGEMAVALVDRGKAGQLDADHGGGGAVPLGQADDPLELGAEAAGSRAAA